MYELKQKLDKDEILSIYTKGFKKGQDYKIGMEYERIPISTSSGKMLDYWTDFGMKYLLETFAKEDTWDYILDDKNIIGLKKGHDTVTLEPGCQFEISTKPEKTIFDLREKINKINLELKPITEKMNIALLNYGVSPYSTYKAINIIPKKRYKIMARYLWGILADVMMRETAGIQCCIDFSSEEDAMRKFKLANKLSPFMCAMYANSPIRGGVDTGYKSFRALSWLNTDTDRCGFFGEMREDFTFKDYIEEVLKVPMIFISRNDLNFEINGKLNFNDFMNGKIKNEEPTIEDYELQANLIFPEVRLRNFIEIRNHDCVGGDLKFSIPAIYKGLFYDPQAMDELEELFAHLTYKDFSQLRYNIPKNALNTRIQKALVLDYAKEILVIAKNSLKRMNTGEEVFLESIIELVNDGLTPADVILRNWYGAWNKNLSKLVKYLISLDC